MYKLGIDLGGTNIVAGVVDENYKIVATGKVKTNLPRPAEEIIDDMVKAANMAIETAGLKISDIDSMGVGSPGAIDPVNGVVCYANNLGFYNVPMAKMLKERVLETVKPNASYSNSKFSSSLSLYSINLGLSEYSLVRRLICCLSSPKSIA